MRNLLIVCLVIAVSMLVATSANAADVKGQISQPALNAMGLGGMTVVSDVRGDAIRGKGVILVQAAYASNCFTTTAAGTLFASKCCPNKLSATSTASVFGGCATSTICVR